MARRTTFVDVPVTYGAVGATQRADLLQYPPKGFRATERSARVGYGEERWQWAVAQLMTWGVKRRAGFRIEKHSIGADEGEQEFSADGAPFIRAGDEAVIRMRIGPFSIREPIRVVYTVDEPGRRGFGYGTLPGHPLSGEESFVLERRPDDSVWFTVRTFSRPAGVLYWLAVPLLRMAQSVVQTRYLDSLRGKLD